MIITLELPPDVEARLREGAARHDGATVRQLLTEAIAPAMEATVAALLRDPDHDIVRRADGLTDAEFEALTDQLVNIAPSLPTLPDEAVSCEGIYEGHRQSAARSVFVARETRRGKAFACDHVQHCDRMNANALPLPTLLPRPAAWWPTSVDRYTTPLTGAKPCVTPSIFSLQPD